MMAMSLNRYRSILVSRGKDWADVDCQQDKRLVPSS